MERGSVAKAEKRVTHESWGISLVCSQNHQQGVCSLFQVSPQCPVAIAPPCLLICVTVRSNVLFFFACCRARRWQCMLRDVTILVQKRHRHAFNPSYQAQLAFSCYLFMTEIPQAALLLHWNMSPGKWIIIVNMYIKMTKNIYSYFSVQANRPLW